MSEVRSRSLQIGSFYSMILQVWMVNCCHFFLGVLGKEKGGEKIPTLLIPTFSQKKIKKGAISKTFKWLFRRDWSLSSPLLKENKNCDLAMQISLELFLHGLGRSAIVQALLCPKHPAAAKHGFISAFSLLCLHTHTAKNLAEKVIKTNQQWQCSQK